jgi:Flp pilus assembly protein TadG
MFALLRKFVSGERAAAAVEFALILPVMLLVYLGSVEGSTLIIVDRKVQSVASAVGDLVARSNGNVTTSDLQDYLRAASGIMLPYPSAGVRQTVSAVTVNANGSTSMLWSSRFQNGVYTTLTNHRVQLPAEMINISRGKTVIAAEASYDFQPLLGLVFDQEVQLYRSSFYLPRFGGTITRLP